jgi:hypothetical protein
VASGASELSRRNVRRGLRRRSTCTSTSGLSGGSTCASASSHDGVRVGGSRWVWGRSVLDRGDNRDGSLGNVDNLNRRGADRDFLLLGDVVGRGVGRLVAAMAGSGRLGWLLGLVTTIGWAIGLGWLSGHNRDVGSRSGRLGQGVGNDSGTAIVTNVDRGDRVALALVADSLSNSLSLGGNTGLAGIDIGGGDDSDGGAGGVRWVVLASLGGDRGRVGTIDRSWAGRSTIDRRRAGRSTVHWVARGRRSTIDGGRAGRSTVHGVTRSGRAGSNGRRAAIGRGVGDRVVGAGARRGVGQSLASVRVHVLGCVLRVHNRGRGGTSRVRSVGHVSRWVVRSGGARNGREAGDDRA